MIGITILAYLIMFLAPGNPASQLALDPELTQRQRAALLESSGANDPFHAQYLRWLIGDAPIVIGDITLWGGREVPVFDRRGTEVGTEVGDTRGILRGDFGTSYVSRRPTLEVIWQRTPATVELGVISLIVGLLFGIPVGVLAAVKQGSWFDQITRILAVLVSSIPVFWLGIMLLLVFSFWLHWLPSGGIKPATFSDEITMLDYIKHLILPVFTLSSFSIAGYSRYMRASLLDVLGQDYIRTAHAKGISPRRVWFQHGMRNALIPIATFLGPSITGVVSGAVLTETIYSWPGMGRLLVDSIRQLDYSVIMAIVLILSVATIIGYLISDILYAVFDPRIRLS
jgi:peptide/nickel transport system permease protein